MTPYPRRISTPIRPLGVPGNKNQKWTETKRSRKWRNQEILRAVRPWVGWIQVKDGLGPGEKYDRSTKANQPPVQLPVVPPLWWNPREYSLTKIRWICFLPFLITFPDLSLWKINTRISGCGIFSPRQLDGRPCEPQTSHCVFWIFPDGIIGASANARKWMESRLIKPRLPGRRTNIISVTIAREYLVVFHTSCTSSYSNGH